jgi:L-threonylcarbamoyladenylate synthase
MQTKFWLLDKNKKLKTQLAEAANLVRSGEVIAFPTETVYGLGANGLDGKAAKKIFAAKGRPADNPLILHIADKAAIGLLSKNLSPSALRLMENFWPGPLTIIVPKSEAIPMEVTAGLETVAVRMPSHPIARALIELAGCPIAAPSANKSGKPSPTNAQAVQEDMEGIIAGIIDGGPSDIGVESTIVDTTSSLPTILRPGGITLEMLEEVLGAVEIDPGLLRENQVPKAPGMKYRHYAPKAEMYLLEGKDASLQIGRFAAQAVAHGKKIGVLADTETVCKLMTSRQIVSHCWGSTRSELAEKLYDYLRRFDQENVDVIVAQGVSEDGLGLAIMNRMRKAAGNNIFKAENGKLILQSGTIPSFL